MVVRLYTPTLTTLNHFWLTSWPVGMCLASLTLAKFPFPIVFSSLYFPTYTSSPGGLDELDFDLPEDPPPLLPELAPAEEGRRWGCWLEGLWWVERWVEEWWEWREEEEWRGGSGCRGVERRGGRGEGKRELIIMPCFGMIVCVLRKNSKKGRQRGNNRIEVYGKGHLHQEATSL